MEVLTAGGGGGGKYGGGSQLVCPVVGLALHIEESLTRKLSVEIIKNHLQRRNNGYSTLQVTSKGPPLRHQNYRNPKINFRLT